MANRHKVGLVFGALFGGMHTLWAILVATGLAQPLFNFIMWAHMIHVPVTIGPFDAGAALSLIVVTSIIGYALGSIGATIWNKLHR